ncbi:hypothetical protein F4777DRAFT_535183 [Nemania sp. FL0916]|nr:hypothetical protein F4777DRAFT_535183 [Nemania sp. FL0916]
MTGDTASSPDSLPSDALGDLRIRRRLVKIPKDQKDLIHRPESWVGFLERRPNGFSNVPPHVLEQVKASYSRQKNITELPTADASPGDTRDHTTDADPTRRQQFSFPRAKPADGNGNGNGSSSKDDEDEDEDEDGDLTSWPSSPESIPNRKPLSFESQDPSHAFITQLPENSPLPPTLTISSLRYSKLPEVPRSSQVPEDDLELQIPAALAHNTASINKLALPMLATPPSAQVVPCTLEQPKPPPPPPGQHIYKPVPELYRRPSLSTNRMMGPHKPATGPSRDVHEASSSSAGTPSSSVIPSTRNDQVGGSKKHVSVRHIAPGRVPQPGSFTVALQRRPLHIRPSLAVGTPSVHEPPFVQYSITYPNYKGTIQDFVTACKYITLQHQRIRTSLYDDFIRAWVEGYLPYVKECDEACPPRKAMRALAWYNEIDDDPSFTSRVVTRQNINSILNNYPDELKSARLHLDIVPSQGTREFLVSGSQPKSHEPQNDNSFSKFPAHSQQMTDREPTTRSEWGMDQEPTASRSTPIRKPKDLPSAEDQRIPTHKSFNGLETQAEKHGSPMRSFSEPNNNKRSAASVLTPEFTKRMSIGSTSTGREPSQPRSISTISNHSELPNKETSRSSVTPAPTPGRAKRKAPEDPESRRRRLKKHFEKHIARQRQGSVASSAAINNTPTSGQQQ